MPWSWFSECWVLSQLFHSLLSLLSRGSLVLLCFLPKGHVICISEAIGISPRNLDFNFASSSPAFCMMYSAYKLNKQGDNIQPWWTPFLIWNQSVVPCLVLTVTSWPAYRFLRRQVRWYGIPISFSTVFHSLLWSTQRLWCSQYSRCSSGTLLLFLWSNGCWQFDLWFLCLF